MGNIRCIREAVLKTLLIPLSLLMYSCSSLHTKKTNVIYECDLTKQDDSGFIEGYNVKFVLDKHPRAYTTSYDVVNHAHTSLATCHYSDDVNGKKWLVCLVDRDVEVSKGLFGITSQSTTNTYVILQPNEGKAYWAIGFDSTGWCSAEHSLGLAIKTLNLGITNDEELCEYAVDNHCKKITQ